MLALRAGRPQCAGLCRASSAALSTSAAVRAAEPRRKVKYNSGMTPRKRTALARARSFAQGVEETKEELIAAASAAESTPEQAAASVSFPPGLDDLNILQPKRRPQVTKGNYAKLHQKLVDRVSIAFNRGQLYEFAKQLNLFPRSTEPKAALVQRILDSWGWVVPRPADWDAPLTQEFQLSTAELVLMQRDPGVADWLGGVEGLSISVQERPGSPDTPPGYTLTAQGNRQVLDSVARFLSDTSKSYAKLEWTSSDTMGFVPSRSTLWVISKVTGAFIETTSQGTYIGTAALLSEVQRARGMILAAAARANAPRPPLAASVPAAKEGQSSRFALTPHLPSSSSPLPWDTAATVADSNLFRMTRSIAPGERAAERESRHRSARMESAAVVPVAGSVEGSSLDASIRQSLKSVPKLDGAQGQVSIQFGHLLVPSDGSALVPPVKGSWTIDASNYLPTLPAPIFSPAVPPSLVKDSLPGASVRQRRVTYIRAGAQDRLTVTYSYPVDERAIETERSEDEPAWIHRLDEMIQTFQPSDKEAEWRNKDSEEEVGFDLKGLLGEEAETSAVEDVPLSLDVVIGNEAVVDVLLPDRPIDARVFARNTRTISQDETPAELVSFFTDLHARPEARHIPLSDLESLRSLQSPSTQDPEDLDLEDETYWFGTDPEPKPEKSEEDDLFIPERPSEPAPTTVSPQKATLFTPPNSVYYASELFYLAHDEVVDMVETARPLAVSDAAPVVVRTVSSVDLRGPGGETRYAQLEAPETSIPALWPELANTTRDVVLHAGTW